MKIFESEKTLAFLDIGPLSKGHSVRLPPLIPLPNSQLELSLTAVSS
jgi:diadenosine tetraphosphate (Ap4A) HIT family hydrolase